MSTVRLSARTVREKRSGGRLTTGMPSMSSIVALDANSSKYVGTIDMWTSGRRTARSSVSVSS